VSREHHFISSARLIIALTLVSRILGMLRDAICSRCFGAGVLHYFYIPFLIPNLARRIFGEGALSAALIPVYTEQLHKDKQAAKALASSVITLLVIILAAITLLGMCAFYAYWHWLSDQGDKSRLILSLAAIMLPYLISICLVAAIGGLLNVHRHFAVPAATPILFNIFIIVGVICFRGYFGDTLWQQVYVIAVAVLLSGFAQLLLQYPALRKVGLSLRFRFSFRDEGLRKIFRLMAPMIVGLAAVQINTLLDMLTAYYLSATPQTGSTFTLAGQVFEYPVKEGSVTYLFYAQRCYQFPLGVFGIAFATAIFPFLSSFAAQKDFRQFSDTLAQGFRLVIFIGLPATVGMILVRLPMVKVIFEGNEFTAADSSHTARALFFYSLGIVAYFVQQLLVRAYYSFQDSVTPVKVAVRMVGANLVLNLILIWPLGTGGMALSTAFCATAGGVVLLVVLIKRYDLKITAGLFACVFKTVIATVVMASGGWWALYVLNGSGAIWQMVVAVPICISLFILTSLLLKHGEIEALLHRK